MAAPLPVQSVLPEVVAALSSTRTCVLVAPTGAGKTTRLPPALLDAGLGPTVVLEPRRIAARAAARRVAQEREVKLGEEVGYQVRFDRRMSSRTKLSFVTEGIFVRRLQDDPFLEGIGCVVLDEFHERSLDLDLSLALVRRIQLEARDDLSLVVTSATLDAEAVAHYLGDAPIVRSEGRMFPVDTRHLPRLSGEREEAHVARGVREALETEDGHVLAFLPGRREIRQAKEALGDLGRVRGIDLVELYGELPAEAQDAALEVQAGRKVVLATNVAESSVTVPGVTSVVDSGLVRRLRHHPGTGLDRLVLERVSAASADQRRGRAGREAPGLCLRLWSASDQRTLSAFEPPEILRADLTGLALQLMVWGERDLAAFPWFEEPPPEALERALALARRLGAIDGKQTLTALGRHLAHIPAHPRLARLLVEGQRLGVPDRAAMAAALLSERDPWKRDTASISGRESDVLDRVRALEAFEDGGARSAPEVHAGGARRILAVKRQLERLGGRLDESARALNENEPPPRVRDADDALLASLPAAFPDRLTRRRKDDPRRGVMVGGRGVRLAPWCSVGECELFLSIELDDGQGEALVRQASVVEREWIDGGRTRTERICSFDTERERVVGHKQVLLGELVIEETEASVDDPREVEDVLLQAARSDLQRALDLSRPEVQTFFARVNCLRSWCPELELPLLDETSLTKLLPELVPGCRSFTGLRKAPLLAACQARLTHTQRQALAKEAPERLEVPSGSRIALTYEEGRPPVLAARIQELFGLKETPRIARGRIPVLLHLLAPNGRPQQITDDLESFWSGTYFDVRKDLRQRYPKHDWPEDPTTAVARRRPGRRRGPR